MTVNNRPRGVEFGSELTGYRTETCDVCVVGSGPGGATAAYELARAGRSVILIEEGSLPQSGAQLPMQGALAKYYRDAGLFTTAWPTQLPVPTGRVFGGTSVINSGTCFHTPDRIFNWWEEDCGVAFDRAAWRAVEAEIDGDLSITRCPEEKMSKSNQLFAEGLKRIGLDGGKPLMRCSSTCDGAGRCCFVCPDDAKQAMHVTLLRRGLENGMRAIIETHAATLLQRGRKVLGLVCRTAAGGRLEIHAKTFILAMGTFETPNFLLKNHLRSLYPALGHHLSIHPAAKVFAEMPEPIRSWEGVPQAYGYDHPDYPDVHFEGVFVPPFLGAINVPFLGADLSEWMRVYDHLAGHGFFVADSTLGRLFRVPGIGPVVRYGLSEKDLDGFFFAMKLIARAYFAVGARRVLLPLLNPKNVYYSEDELERGFRRKDLRARELYAMGFHPLGTCRFSPTIESGVVDRNGRCHQHDNLYICDGSAIPGPLHVNPQITIMAFSRLASRNLME
ncbi:MAG: hypothetical protein QG656_2394 [Candidatus Hydrogenedentes bacterium]|nr:hypothetical protein [Candidatus Hydrogenedentota bacterium]